ncbi:MAG: hydroxyacid dehydrogenase [Alphaproteobacteria bacterium]
MPNARLTCFLPLPATTARTLMETAKGIDLTVLTHDMDEAAKWAALEAAHGQVIGASRQELPKDLHVTAAYLERCPNVLAVSSTGAGYDTIDLDACTAAGVIAVNQAGANKEAVAEHTMAMMLTLGKRIGEADRRLRRERGFARADLIGTDIVGKTIGIVGIGHIGTRVARLCEGLLGMRVIAVDPYVDGQEIARRGAELVDMETLLAESDVVTIHCPRTAETLRLMDAEAFGKMKAGAFFINTARGGIHDEAALFDALASGHLGGAGVDVWDDEPPPLDHPLLSLDNVVATPHTAGITRESRENVAQHLATQMIGIFRGERPPRLLNPEAWDTFQGRYGKVFK